MKLTAIKRLVEEDKMHMEVIINNKVWIYLDVIQLFKLDCLVGLKPGKVSYVRIWQSLPMLWSFSKKNKHPAPNNCCALFQISALPVGNQSK